MGRCGRNTGLTCHEPGPVGQQAQTRLVMVPAPATPDAAMIAATATRITPNSPATQEPGRWGRLPCPRAGEAELAAA